MYESNQENAQAHLYKVTLDWCPGDREQGNYQTHVWATSDTEAVQLAAKIMVDSGERHCCDEDDRHRLFQEIVAGADIYHPAERVDETVRLDLQELLKGHPDVLISITQQLEAIGIFKPAKELDPFKQCQFQQGHDVACESGADAMDRRRDTAACAEQSMAPGGRRAVLEEAIAALALAKTDGGELDFPIYKTAYSRLVAMLVEVREYDGHMELIEKAPDGDDYNNLFCIVMN